MNEKQNLTETLHDTLTYKLHDSKTNKLHDFKTNKSHDTDTDKLHDVPSHDSMHENSSMINCNYIQPVPTQILSLHDKNNQDIHITLDSGATVSYVKLSVAKALNLKIRPNAQLSKLADGKTKMSSVGEVQEIFYRNDWSVKFHAIVTKELHADIIGGNNFILDNKIIQDFDQKNILVHKKYTVPETSPSLILPTQPNNLLLQNNFINVLLPGQSINYDIPHAESTTLAVQPWHQNKLSNWPDPQLCIAKNGAINIKLHHHGVLGF